MDYKTIWNRPEKNLLISFLNALFNEHEDVKDVTFLNIEHLGTQELNRRAVFVERQRDVRIGKEK